MPNSSTDSLSPIIYRYPWYVSWATLLLNIAAFLMPAWLLVEILVRGVAQNLMPSNIVYALANLLFINVAFILTANFWSEISADEEGLLVSFLAMRLRVKWQDIIDIKPFGLNLAKRPPFWVVRTHALTPFHRLYGLLYGLTFNPSFIITAEITNRDELISKIKRRKFI